MLFAVWLLPVAASAGADNIINTDEIALKEKSCPQVSALRLNRLSPLMIYPVI
nr:hypothetical protein [Moraxella equi]